MRIVVALQPEVASVVGPLRLHRVAQNPIARRLLPADSCMGGYRTPARLRTLGPLRPASDTLHHTRRSAQKRGIPKPDTRGSEPDDLDGWGSCLSGFVLCSSKPEHHLNG